MALIKCPECNQSMSSRASHCPNCGCPIETVKSENSSLKKAAVKKIISLILILSLCTIAVYYISQKLLHQGYYNHHKWGTSFESFLKAYPDDADSKSNQSGDSFFRMCDSFEGIPDLNVIEDYHFEDKRLYSVGITISPSKSCKLSSRQLSKQILEKYNRYYGNAECLEGGVLSSKVYKWSTPKSVITLYPDSIIVILYTDLNHTKD